MEDVIPTEFTAIVIEEVEFANTNCHAVDSIDYNNFMTSKTR